MQVSKSERPGVYSSYSTSKVSGTVAGLKSVGIVASNEVASGNLVYRVTSVEEALEVFGAGVMAELVETALGNGAVSASCVAVAETVVTVPDEPEVPVVPPVEPEENLDEDLEEENLEDENLEEISYYQVEEEDQSGGGYTELTVAKDYAGGFALLEKEDGLAMILCDSTDLEVQQELRDSVERCSMARKERIGIVATEVGGTVAEACAQAQELNSERMVLVAGSYGSGQAGIQYAAAVAGVLAKETDPALPLNGLSLQNVTALEENYSDSEVELLLQSGVLALEQSSGVVSVIRGVTTCQDTGTWHDLTTIMVVDNVIPGLRDLLKGQFQRVKNTALTRGAMRSAVVMELDRKLTSEIIVEYGDIQVEASELDPSVCVVSFSFAVAYGLNQIWLSATVQV